MEEEEKKKEDAQKEGDIFDVPSLPAVHPFDFSTRVQSLAQWFLHSFPSLFNSFKRFYFRGILARWRPFPRGERKKRKMSDVSSLFLNRSDVEREREKERMLSKGEKLYWKSVSFAVEYFCRFFRRVVE